MSDGPIMRESAFRALIGPRVQELVSLARYACGNASEPACFTRPLLGDLLPESTRTEEMLDAYGARRNRSWSPLRRAVAATKLFAQVGCILLHIRCFPPTYRLLPVGRDFEAATQEAFRFTCATLSTATRELLRLAEELGVAPQGAVPGRERFAEQLVPGRLPRVLEDIKLLAENGYGEDDFGNNLPLPARLSYLRK